MCVCVCVIQLLFILIDVSEPLSHVLSYFAVSKDDAPTMRIINMDTGKKYANDSEELTIDSLRQLCQEVVDGTAKVLQMQTVLTFSSLYVTVNVRLKALGVK